MTIAQVEQFTVLAPTAALADPHVLSDIRDRRSIIDSVYDALVRRRADGGFDPWLAQQWQSDATCRHWRFTLRQGVRCHDGAILQAEDAAQSILRALSPALPGELGTQGVLRGYLEGATISASDQQTLEIHTSSPMADLLDLLVDIPVVPAHALSALPGRVVGSGPYELVSSASGRVELRAFEAHWAGRPPVHHLLWLAEPDATQRMERLAAGEADLVVDPPKRLLQSTFSTVYSEPSYLCIILLFNLFEGPCRDVRVRQALNHALDLAALIQDADIAAGHAVPLAGPVSPRHFGADAHLAPYAYDPERARALLRAAGYSSGLELNIDLPARFPDESVPLVVRISEYFAAVGVRVRFSVHHDRPDYAERIRAKRFGDLCCFDSSPASSWRVYCEKLDSRRAGPWWQGYVSPALHDLIDQVGASFDDGQRAVLLRQAYALVHQDAPWLFLYAPDNRWALGPAAAGWRPSIEGRVRLVSGAQ